MKYIITIFIFLTIVFSENLSMYAQSNTSLIAQLDSMIKEDQEIRFLLGQIWNGAIDSIDVEIANQRLFKVDSSNHQKLVEINKKYGYPGYDKIGKEGAHNFWLLVQHQDLFPEFQEKVLKHMKVEAKNGNASYANYAYLRDRVNINSGKKQIFGNQLIIDEDSSSFILRPVIKPKSLELRRKKAGLPPIDFYINTMNERYFGDN